MKNGGQFVKVKILSKLLVIITSFNIFFLQMNTRLNGPHPMEVICFKTTRPFFSDSYLCYSVFYSSNKFIQCWNGWFVFLTEKSVEEELSRVDKSQFVMPSWCYRSIKNAFLHDDDATTFSFVAPTREN